MPHVNLASVADKHVDLRATAWSNGQPRQSGAGYGVRIAVADRDRVFDPKWNHVVIDLGAADEAVIGLSASFWASCTELRSAAVGRWLIRHGLAPWSRGAPPTLILTRTSGNLFRLRTPAQA